MTLKRLIAWLNAPTSRAGEVAVLGAFSAWLTNTVTWPQAVAAAVGGALLIALPDNSVARSDIEQIVQEVLAAAEAKKS